MSAPFRFWYRETSTKMLKNHSRENQNLFVSSAHCGQEFVSSKAYWWYVITLDGAWRHIVSIFQIPVLSPGLQSSIDQKDVTIGKRDGELERVDRHPRTNAKLYWKLYPCAFLASSAPNAPSCLGSGVDPQGGHNAYAVPRGHTIRGSGMDPLNGQCLCHHYDLLSRKNFLR